MMGRYLQKVLESISPADSFNDFIISCTINWRQIPQPQSALTSLAGESPQ